MHPSSDPVAGEPIKLASDQILLGENLELLPALPSGSFQLIYIDPPFNTGKRQTRKTLEVHADEDGERRGFQGRRYRSRLLEESSYRDSFDDYLAFLSPRLEHGDPGLLGVPLAFSELHPLAANEWLDEGAQLALIEVEAAEVVGKLTQLYVVHGP